MADPKQAKSRAREHEGDDTWLAALLFTMWIALCVATWIVIGH